MAAAGIEHPNDQPQTQTFKVFNDPVHGTIKLHPLLVRIIDTPQFQRLRNIKQLGGGSFVYPGACHTRFEHCIGVAHLAGEFARALRPSAPDMDDKDVLCVQIAGLCHDVGHGPFSHMFDDMFINEFSKKKHEDISIEMFDHLVEQNGLRPQMKLYGLEEIDLTFIKEMINPGDTYVGRTADKHFLYEIVSNKTNGVDVDKFDYFARDCHYLGLQNCFDHRRFIEFARVCKCDDGKRHICMRDKELDNVYDIFQTRYRLHKQAYQHRVVKAVELMIKDAFLAAKDLQIEGTNKKLCEAANDMAAYSKLTDHVFQQILYSSDDNLKKAKEILERIMTRDLYDSVKVQVREKKTEDIEKEINKMIPKEFEVKVVKFGSNKKDPIKGTYFYRKNDPDKPFRKEEDSEKPPGYTLEMFFMVFQKEKGTEGDWATISEGPLKPLKQWCTENGFELLEDDGPKRTT